jgi:hypothetical protein
MPSNAQFVTAELVLVHSGVVVAVSGFIPNVVATPKRRFKKPAVKGPITF